MLEEITKIEDGLTWVWNDELLIWVIKEPRPPLFKWNNVTKRDELWRD